MSAIYNPTPRMEFTLFGGLRAHVRTLLLAVALLAGSLLFFSRAHAATYYWAGSGSNINWENPSCWSTLPKGHSGANVVPGASDTAVLLSSGTTVRIRSNVTVGALTLSNVWTGSIVYSTGSLFVRGALRFGSGKIVTGTGTLSVGGAYTQTGGMLRSARNINLSGATVSITNLASTFLSTGTLLFTGKTDQAVTFGNTVRLSLRGLTLNNTGGGTSDDIAVTAAGGLNLSGALLVTQGNLDLNTNNVAMVTESGVVLASNAQSTLTTDQNLTVSGSFLVGDDAILAVTAGVLTLNGGANQNLDLDGQSIYSLTINKSVSTTDNVVVLADSQLNLSGSLIITLGNLDLTTNTETSVIEGSVTLANAAQATLASNTDMTIGGDLTVNDAATITKTGTLTLNGTTQTFDIDGQSIPTLYVGSSTSATLGDHATVSTTLQINTGATLIIPTTLILTGTTITFHNYGTLTQQGTGKLYHQPASALAIMNSLYTAAGPTPSAGTPIYFSITDEDANVSGTTADSLSVTITLTDGDSETLGLSETSNTSGVFQGYIETSAVSATASNGTVESTTVKDLTATYTDSQDGLASTTTALFRVPSSSTSTSTTGSSSGGGGGGGGGGRRTSTTNVVPTTVSPNPLQPTRLVPGEKLTPKQRSEQLKANAKARRDVRVKALLERVLQRKNARQNKGK